jgi:hypothetical protein
MNNINTEAVTLCLSRRIAMKEGRNQQAAMIHTARVIRAETKSKDSYESLGLFLTATPAERQKVVELTERMLLEAMG